MTRKIGKPEYDQPMYVVYKVEDWRKYWFNDLNPVIAETGLIVWQARQKVRELNRQDFDGPLHPDGCPIGRYKYCSQADWDKERKQVGLF